MKLLGFVCIMAICLFIVISCQKEYSLENALMGKSTGTLKTVDGDCLPSGSNGTFKKGLAVDSSNYIYVDIDVFSPGAYLVKSDTVNGMRFNGDGAFETKGIHTVRLNASGTPFTNGTVPYVVKYGSQKCVVNVFTVN